jgi:competence protein ComEA
MNEASTVTTGQSQSGLININAAGSTELQEIPGIGEKKAQAIIDYRNQNGPFRSINDLTKVKGIGAKMLEKMKPYIGLR